jgi:hypothetical protein
MLGVNLKKKRDAIATGKGVFSIGGGGMARNYGQNKQPR